MKRSVGVFFIVMAVCGLAVAPAAMATPPAAASGTWQWKSRAALEKLPDGSQILSGSEDSQWSGSFEGTSLDTFSGILRNDGGVVCMMTVFYTGQVLGVGGSMIMELTVFADKISTPGEGGHWRIKDGAGGLKGLRGEGDWSWTGPAGKGTYSGHVQWE